MDRQAGRKEVGKKGHVGAGRAPYLNEKSRTERLS